MSPAAKAVGGAPSSGLCGGDETSNAAVAHSGSRFACWGEIATSRADPVLPVVIRRADPFNAPGSAFASGLGSPELVAAAAFGIGAYALMFSAFQALNAEGPALWILYSVPHPLESVLREKAVFWGTLCLGYALAVLGLGLAFNPVFSLQQLELMAVVLLGLPIFAMIGASLGVFACAPFAQVVQRRLRPSYVYLYMLLASLYVYAIYASSIWQRTGLIVLTGLLGMALWQKARDHLPYLLDPDASPPARVSVADGLIAALIFFVLQALVALVLSYGEGKLTGRVVLIAFSVAGATTYVCMRFAYWRLGTDGVPPTIDPAGSAAAASWAVRWPQRWLSSTSRSPRAVSLQESARASSPDATACFG